MIALTVIALACKMNHRTEVRPVDVTTLALTVELAVGAPASEVFDALADPTRVPEWSPECVHIAWTGGADGAEPGARFYGRNRAGEWEWDVTCEMVEVRRPEAISW